MVKYLKNGLLLVLMAILGVLAGLGVSKYLNKNKPQIEMSSGTIKPISQKQALQKFKFPVLTPKYFDNKRIVYYIFPEGHLKVDYEEGKSKIPLASLDIIPTKNAENKKRPYDVSFSFSHGTAYIKQMENNSLIWFNKNNVNYELTIQNSHLPKDKQKLFAELKKITLSFKEIKNE